MKKIRDFLDDNFERSSERLEEYCSIPNSFDCGFEQGYRKALGEIEHLLEDDS